MSTPEHEARAALMRAADAGDTVMGRLVSRYGAPQTAEFVRTRTLPPALTPQDGSEKRPADLGRRLSTWHARLAAADPAADMAAGHKAGARLIIPGDPEWPTQLDQLGSARPIGLWLHGTADLRFSCLRSVAVVGARAATAYGVHVAAQFGVGLSESGWTVVSGGAFGIDGAVHRGALAADSPTVVVLACGADICYPSEHHSLFAAARDQGVIVSECPPGVHPTRARFLIRNRLIAALSRGTAVVEAALRSGALNTATHAMSLGRHLAAVPGPITSTQSAGCHKLLREQKAVCVTSPEELIDLVGVIGDDLAPTLRAPALPRDALSASTRRVLDAVPARGGAGPASIAVSAGVDLNTALSSLGALAAAGYIERAANGWRTRKTASPVYPKARDTLVLNTAPQPAPDNDPPRPKPTGAERPSSHESSPPVGPATSFTDVAAQPETRAEVRGAPDVLSEACAEVRGASDVLSDARADVRVRRESRADAPSAPSPRVDARAVPRPRYAPDPRNRATPTPDPEGCADPPDSKGRAVDLPALETSAESAPGSEDC
ncbi:DNA-processing protein DprA [Nonomuraea sp. LPB2021202275-12-8]|uniref:DNA-processing protein DprA n=1 Tax=Nonomuraea sp. LPB2021202275-12-8 TaxID=3120159 RepID=UPI00300CF7C4